MAKKLKIVTVLTVLAILATLFPTTLAVNGVWHSARGDLTAFSDGGGVADWATDAMSWANGEKLINGMGDGTVAPQGTATRAQVAQVLLNFAG